MVSAPTLDLAYASSLIESIAFDDHLPAERAVYVFRTSVPDRACVEMLRPALDRLAGRTGRWSFDLEDRDHVLRIETDHADIGEVMRVMQDRGQQCEQLD